MSGLRVLFLGGTGIISSACSWRAVEAGLDLTVVNRGKTSTRPLPPEARTITADVGDPSSFAAVAGQDFDVVVDWVAFTPDQVRARHRRAARACRPVRVHQLRVGVPDATGAAADHRVDAAAQPVLAVLAQQDRL